LVNGSPERVKGVAERVCCLYTPDAEPGHTLPNFDPVAPVYRWAEYLSLGPLLQWTRTAFLPEVCGDHQALILGDGDGRFTAALMARSPETQVVAVDASAAMLGLLAGRCRAVGAGARLRVKRASVMDVDAPAGTDLVVTHFLLDCLRQDEVDRLAAKLARQVQPGCLWLLSEFGMPRWRWAQPLAALYIRGLYLAFRVLTGLRQQRLPDPQRALAGAGFVRCARRERLGGLLYTELWRLAPAAGSERV
jgi:ubiquinone/menaquinone biosynthesis C-methylase UbiE